MLPRFAALMGLAILSCLWVTGDVSAQSLPWSRQGTYIYRELQRYDTPTYNFVPGTAMTPSAGVETSRANYPAIPVEEPVRVRVSVPADAKVSFQGTMTRQTGTQRFFESPPIFTGYNYFYEVQARWMENGREVVQSRRVSVQPGDNVNITFTRDNVNVSRNN